MRQPPNPAGVSGGSKFELDGDALQDASPAPPEDWELLFTSGGGTSVAFSGIVPDPGQDTIFEGGKKDIQELNRWTWKNNGGFPDKNDITNAYAAAYRDTNGDLIVYFGADRFSNTGDAFLGFWFFKDRVGLNPNGTFDGDHQVGDILVLINYPQGSGAAPEVQVLEWNPAQQNVATNLRLLFSGGNALCGRVPPFDACAITNSANEPSPWAYDPKAGTSGVFPPESFFEGGINLTKILGGTFCFSSFLAETRSSTSISATLKDFVLGEFPVCDIDVTKTCKVVGFTPNFQQFVVEFTAKVTNSGAGTFPAGSVMTVTDDAGTPGDPSDDVVIKDTLAVPYAPGDVLTYNGQFISNQNPPFNTVVAEIKSATASVMAEAYGIECDPLPLNPALDLSKMCSLALETVGGLLVVRVDFTGQVTNTGDVPLYVTVVDDKFGVVLPSTLLLPTQSRQLKGSYYPTSANGGVTDPSLARFSDTFTATGTNPILPQAVVEMISANCDLCP